MSVPDIEAATRWYADILGFELIGNQIKHIKRSQTPSAPIFGIFGESLNEVKLAWMTTGNGVGFELFQFVDPAFKKNDVSFEYNRSGFFHVCVTDKQPDALAAKVVAAGGRRVGTTQIVDGGVCCLYLQDPWGNVVEVLDVSFDRQATFATASKL